ncbi:hypothetical protein EVAR_5541_1 [Eumeta japonica]|uniref:Uncharacterized protein n=1 Tax=Eumeta variegata TaxID=151549 RepID=A0A4C1T976_EUMVA|nr:hypothetical protein EVAR_5541_1 [Eumeta japonica]
MDNEPAMDNQQPDATHRFGCDNLAYKEITGDKQSQIDFILTNTPLLKDCRMTARRDEELVVRKAFAVPEKKRGRGEHRPRSGQPLPRTWNGHKLKKRQPKPGRGNERIKFPQTEEGVVIRNWKVSLRTRKRRGRTI